jgi:cobalt/nickel transport system permease protein
MPSTFIEHTLSGISETLERSIFAEQVVHLPGFLQKRDPRVKIIGLAALLLAVSLSHSLAVIAALYLMALGLAVASAVPLKLFITRVWLFMPFFTGVIALPAFFITPGPALVHLPLGLVITQTGATSALFLLLRVGTSVSLTALLILTTPWNTVLKALKVLYLPDVVVLILGMTYRYIYLLLRIANDIFLARKSRSVGRLDGAGERRMVGAAAGVLLSRSLHMSSEVYLAMQSRGFYRSPRTLDTFKMTRTDWLACLGAAVIALAATWLGR